MKYWDYSAFDMDDVTSGSSDTFRVADEVSRCLEAALDRMDLEVTVMSDDGVPGFYPDNIRINKAAYMAIRKFDLPLVTTWYKYGQYEPYESLRADNLKSGKDSDSNGLVYKHPQRGSITRGRVISFFTNRSQEIKSLWDYDLWDFMGFNYGRRAPEYLKEAYLANTKILKVIDKLYTGDYDPEIHRKELKQGSMDLRYELSTTPRFSQEVSDYLEEFLLSLENALLAYDNIHEPTRDQVEFLRSTKPLYHQVIWQVPALEIAVNEVKGPQGGSYQSRLEGHIPESKERLAEGLSEWLTGMEEVRLTPSANTYRSSRSKPNELKGLEKALINTDTNGRR